MLKTQARETQSIRKARQDIAKILVRYDVTLPEVLRTPSIGDLNKEDERVWNMIRKDYRRIRGEVHKEA